MEKVIPMEVLGVIPFDYIMWGVLGVTLLVFSVYSAVLLWHWKIYSTGKFTTVSNMMLYLGVSGLFIAVMALSTLAYTFI